MKKKLKGLLSLWLAAIMLFGILPATVLAGEEKDEKKQPIYVCTDDTPVKAGMNNPVYQYYLIHSLPTVKLNTSLDTQLQDLGINDTGKFLDGWRLWKTVRSGNDVGNEYRILASDAIIDNDLYNEYCPQYSGNFPFLEPLWRPQYKINPQPTIPYDPYVGAEILNDNGEYEVITDDSGIDVSYQWYTVEYNDPVQIIESSSYGMGIYPTEENKWHSENSYENQCINITFKVNEGDVITFSPSEGFRGTVNNSVDPKFNVENGVYTCTATEDNNYFCLYAESNDNFTAEITVTKMNKTLVKDRTDCHLINDKDGKVDRTGLVNETAYLCGVTFAPKTTTFAARATNDSVTLYSDIAIYKYELTGIEVTEQPKLDYTDGDALDLSAMVVTAHYSDGSSELLDYTDVDASITHGTELTVDDHNGVQIEITYNGKTAQTEALTVQQKQSGEEEDFDYDFFNWSVMMLYSQEYDITAVTTDGGNITPEGVTKVKYDRNITYTITPDEGYMISDVLVDGESVGAVTEYTFKRVKKDHTIEAVFEEIKWQNPYTDVAESDWYYSDVEFVTENGLMNGMETDEFEPYTALNRAMLVTVLWRLEGEPAANAAMQFTDVADGEWYTEAVRWAAAEGIVNGYGDETFGPMNDVTREQVMAILHRYAAYKSLDSGVIFPMIPQYEYSLWAENDIIWADMVGLTSDLGVDIIDMTASADRAEIAAYLSRFCEAFAE